MLGHHTRTIAGDELAALRVGGRGACHDVARRLRSWTIRIEDRDRVGEPRVAARFRHRDHRGGWFSACPRSRHGSRPDVAFVRADRVPPGGVKGYFQGAPDLAVEVVSPSDRPDEVAAKVQEWLQAGCSMVWVVQPDSRTVAVHRRGHEVTALKGPDALVGGDVLPEFSMPVTTIFG